MVDTPQIPLARPALPIELHQATRSVHASLNRTIVAHLPMCIPPHATGPSSYAMGMTAYQHIYIAFESAWHRLRADTNVNDRQKEMVHRLHCLQRSTRLRQDLQNIKNMLGPAEKDMLSHVYQQTCHFQDVIALSIEKKPHLLFAYFWTMYLALFNGGRWIVGQLNSPGSEYWFGEEDQGAVAEKYLSFWFFDETPRDHKHGEHVKSMLKQSLDAVEASFTDNERDDVIEECKRLFGMCAELIELLDKQALNTLPTHQSDTSSQELPAVGNSTLLGYLASFTPIANVWQSLRTTLTYSKATTVCSPQQEIHQSKLTKV